MSTIRQCRRCGNNVVSPSGPGDGAYPVAPMCECPENQPNPANYPDRQDGSPRPMTLLEAVRQDAEVVKARKHLAHCLGPMADPDDPADDKSVAFRDHDTALLRAAVREIARRVREDGAKAMVASRDLEWVDPSSPQASRLSMTYLSQNTFVDLAEVAADFLERMGADA